jgi:hypothetical protein
MKENISTDKLSILYAMYFIVYLKAYHDITVSLNIHVTNLKFLEERCDIISKAVCCRAYQGIRASCLLHNYRLLSGITVIWY